jgi:multidrug transporter EmrE-like cation transporter
MLVNWWLLLIVALALVGVIGDAFIKTSATGQEYIIWRWFILGALIYALSAAGWFFAFKHVKFTSLGVFYALGTVLFFVLIGVFYFKDQLNAYEFAGIAAAAVAIVLLGRFA